MHPVQRQVGDAPEDDAVHHDILLKDQQAESVYKDIQNHGDSPYAEVGLSPDAQQAQNFATLAQPEYPSGCQRYACPGAAHTGPPGTQAAMVSSNSPCSGMGIKARNAL